MGLSWQRGPLSTGAVGRFLVPESLPHRLLYAEPLRRRMRVSFGATWIADCERSLGFDSAYTQALSSRFCVMPVKYQRTVQHNQKVFDGADLVRILSEVR
jgi:hypothetical protein